jgi:cytochrome c oxidase cbb3-type subunit I/II
MITIRLRFESYLKISPKNPTKINQSNPIPMNNTTLERFYYDNKIVKYFGAATIIWGIVGMLVGVLAATQLFLPEANMGNPYTTFGRIRPLHTNAVIFAFVGNAIFAGIYYSMPRLLKTPMWSKALS